MILHICQPLIDLNSTMDIINNNLLRLTKLYCALHLCLFFFALVSMHYTFS